MGLNFPSAPLVGDLFPVPAQPNVPQYAWDGEKWKAGFVDTSLYVRKSGDAMTGLLALSGDPTLPLHAVPRQWAAPMDAMAYNGIQVNGSFQVSQELDITGSGVNATYFRDQWALWKSGAMVVNASSFPSGGTFPWSPRSGTVTVSTALASLGANDYVAIVNFIEGYRAARLGWGTPAAQPLTISFWSAHNRAGTHSICVQNNTQARSYVTTYTQNVANTVEYKTVTIPGDTAGTWLTDNRQWGQIVFPMAASTGVFAPATGVWSGSGGWAAAGQVNGVASTADFFRLCGVTILPGADAPSAVRSQLIQRPYIDEQQLCKRFYERSSMSGNADGTGNGVAVSLTATRLVTGGDWVEKRATPTVTFYHPSTGQPGQLWAAGVATINIQAYPSVTPKGWGTYMDAAAGSGLVVGLPAAFQWKADARF